MSIKHQQQAIRVMIQLFCRHHHGTQETLCEDCQNLRDYALIRLSRCRYGDDKPTCRQCVTHCYQKQMRTQMNKVMRFAGPRMILHHPIMAVRHFWSEKRSKPASQATDQGNCQSAHSCEETNRK
jgi:hypothetical protein